MTTTSASSSRGAARSSSRRSVASCANRLSASMSGQRRNVSNENSGVTGRPPDLELILPTTAGASAKRNHVALRGGGEDASTGAVALFVGQGMLEVTYAAGQRRDLV